MTLKALVSSSEWNEHIKKDFFEKLKRTRYKAQNCINKAENILKGVDPKKIDNALELLDYVFTHFSEEKLSIARAYHLQGRIFEEYLRRYRDAYDSFTKWASLKTYLGGHEFARLRTLLRANKLQATPEVFHFLKEVGKRPFYNLPFRNFRFWVQVFNFAVCEAEEEHEKAKEYAQKAFMILAEKNPTLLQTTIRKLKNYEDRIDVTDEEIAILKKMIS